MRVVTVEQKGKITLPADPRRKYDLEAGLIGIYTFDQKMNRFPGVERLEP